MADGNEDLCHVESRNVQREYVLTFPPGSAFRLQTDPSASKLHLNLPSSASVSGTNKFSSLVLLIEYQSKVSKAEHSDIIYQTGLYQ